MQKSSLADLEFTVTNHVRAAVIGYGLAGSAFHAPLISSTENMEVAAIVTRSKERQAEAQRDYPAAVVYNSADELWRHRKEYDLAVVATPNDSHMDLGLAAIASGMPVVIDKPVAISSAQTEKLIEASKSSGVLLSVFQNRRWDNDFLTIRALLDSGKLGKITRMESRFERFRLAPKPGGWREQTSAEAGGGLLFDLGSHLIDQAMQLFGKPSSVYAEVLSRRADVSGDDDTFVALNFGDDVIVHIWVSMLAPSLGARFRVSGMAGAYEKWGLDPQENALKEGDRPGSNGWGREHPESFGTLTTYENGVQKQEKVESVRGAYETYYAAIRDAILLKTAPPVDATDALACLRVIEAARKSAEKRTIVQLSEDLAIT